MNSQVDVIVIGDSASGNEAVRKIATANPLIRMVFVSREFKMTTTHDFLNVEYIQDEVLYTDYRNRLFGCYLKNGDRLYCTHLIVATGLKYEPFLLGNKVIPDVFNNTENIPKYAKNLPALVICRQNSDVKFALAVAKKYKHVYVCTSSVSLEGFTASNVKKLNDTENIVVLPNTMISKVITHDDHLEKVELTNYSIVTCSAIFVKTESKPEVSFISDKLIKKDTDGYLETDQNLESSYVPKCFALGNCNRKSNKKMCQSMLETILKDFEGGF